MELGKWWDLFSAIEFIFFSDGLDSLSPILKTYIYLKLPPLDQLFYFSH